MFPTPSTIYGPSGTMVQVHACGFQTGSLNFGPFGGALGHFVRVGDAQI